MSSMLLFMLNLLFIVALLAIGCVVTIVLALLIASLSINIADYCYKKKNIKQNICNDKKQKIYFYVDGNIEIVNDE